MTFIARMKGPTPDKLRELLEYDPETGALIWKTRESAASEAAAKIWNKRFSGKEAGCLTEKGYLKVRIGKKKYYAHRIAWAIHHGEWPDVIDHVNHEKSDNRISNLRSVKFSENLLNRPPQKNSKVFVGVHRHKECYRWVASIGHKGRPVYLGLYACIGKAIKARREAERDLGFHENHGGVR